MIYSIDTSALLSVLLNEPHKARIIELTEGCELIAPSSLDAEVGNALSAMMKRDRISLEIARKVIRQFSQIPIQRKAIRLGHSVELASKFTIYSYDAYVLDCSIQFRTPLISLNAKMNELANKLKIITPEVNI